MALDSLCGFSTNQPTFKAFSSMCALENDLKVFSGNFANNMQLMLPPAIDVSAIITASANVCMT